MAVIGIDLGGTKLSSALFSDDGDLLRRSQVPLGGRGGTDVGHLVISQTRKLLANASIDVHSVGVSIPGIYRAASGRVWAPNIPGWEDYPLRDELSAALPSSVQVYVDSDRACSMLGELWRGAARGCRDAIFLAVGTGIGAGILAGGRILRGTGDIAGAIGWLALDRPHRAVYRHGGCFEYHASGPGLVRVARDLIAQEPDYDGPLAGNADLTTRHVFEALWAGDPLAQSVLENAVEFWGMTVANLVSLFNPEKIIFGGGVFGPASRYLDQIRDEALKWAQPISIQQVTLHVSGLGGDSGLYGAGRLALGAGE